MLFQMTFKRPANDRQLTFKEIAMETKLPVNDVSHLLFDQYLVSTDECITE